MKYYAIIGGICGGVIGIWMCSMFFKAGLILDKGKMIRVAGVSTFTQKDRAYAEMRIAEMSVDLVLITCFAWPYILSIFPADLKEWNIIDEIEVRVPPTVRLRE